MFFPPLRSRRRVLIALPAILTAAIAALTLHSASAQTRPPVGIRQHTPAVHAFINARIVPSPGEIIPNGTLVIRDGMITAVGADASVPADARIWDMKGMTIYPGFIDAYSDYGMPKKPQPGQGDGQKPADAHGAKYWNGNVLAATRADDLFTPDPQAAEKMRGMGFTTALVVPTRGIFRGTSAVVEFGDGTANEQIVRPACAQHCTFETSGGDDYPDALMGTIALIRQTFLDANWYREAMAAAARYPSEPRPDAEADLAALGDAATGAQPVMFESTDELSILRADRIAKEFKLKAMIRGCGTEYRRLEAVKGTGMPVILPLNFPEAPGVQTPEDALGVPLEDLRYWDEAPGNPAKLQEAGVQFALTTATLKDVTAFSSNLRRSIERGLTPDAALAALTTVPARILGLERKLGSLAAGKAANFIIADGDLFKERTKIRETWIDGKRYETKPLPPGDPRGTWVILLNGAPPVDSLTLLLKGDADALQGSVKGRGKEAKVTSASMTGMVLSLAFAGDSLGLGGIVRLTGALSEGTLIGTNDLPNGKSIVWGGKRISPFMAEADTSKPAAPAKASFGPLYPPGAFGRAKLPAQPAKLFVRNATVWTSGPQGTLDGADMLIEKGKIVSVGRHLTAPADAVVVDGTGKHVTAGLIDCHSHTGVAGSVNEAGHAISAEVRIGDVLDPDDIALYRELAGGLTCANVLHGSANAIGGQNQVIKLRWGSLPEEMKFEGAMPGIKFALGENPKQSNWGDKYTTRYPQTRSGVEQIIRDEFKAALDYERTWKDYHDGKIRIPPRRDLQLDAVLEILRGKRLVHSHSYRQDEIEMLMRVAEEFGFRVATFQHVLEGYKVAAEMARHGAGGSTFSDWWAYKFEVYDAIPYNGALMHDAGVVVSYNSDSDELARHLNTEAAKAVKYGGVTQDEALKFVTLNPAKQLRIDQRVGSLEAGKDADFVVWSGNPLSTYSICEQTWIDGKKYFDRTEDQAMREEVSRERAALVQKILTTKGGGGGASGGGRPASSSEAEPYSCHIGEER